MTQVSSSFSPFSPSPPPPLFLFYLFCNCAASPCLLFFVVSKLNGKPVAHAAERCRLHLPVVDGVFKQADAIIERPLHPEPSRAEVVHAHMTDVIGMEVHHLKERAWQREQGEDRRC